LKVKRETIVVAGLTCLLYIGAILVGLGVHHMTFFPRPAQASRKMDWVVPRFDEIPADAHGDSIRRGALLFNDTFVYAPQYARAHVSCTSCHAEGGVQPYASPMVGLSAVFPTYNKRAGHVIPLSQRIQECFVRSENGEPLPGGAPEMQQIVDYITWLSQPEPSHMPFKGRGLAALPALQPDARQGEVLYAAQCAGCHGVHGEGRAPLFPPLWGPDSFNSGAGMNSIKKMAPFVQHNMPQNRMGILSAQDAWDVSAYIHGKPRPALNAAYSRF